MVGLYAKDIAVKIRSSRVKQFERGSFSSCHPVYGYDVVKEGNHEPIISEEVFQEVARRFEARSQKFSSGSSRNLPLDEDIYKDLLYCGLCGDKFTRECGLTNRSGGKVRNYHYRRVDKEATDDRKYDNNRISLIMLNRLVEEALEKSFLYHL